MRGYAEQMATGLTYMRSYDHISGSETFSARGVDLVEVTTRDLLDARRPYALLEEAAVRTILLSTPCHDDADRSFVIAGGVRYAGRFSG